MVQCIHEGNALKVKEEKMTKKEAISKAREMKSAGRNVRVAYQTLVHANRNGAQTTSLVYRVVENGVVVA